MEQFEKRKGTFKPKRTDDLKNNVDKFIGMHCTWKAMWIIGKGSYEGLWAMAPCIGADDHPYVPFSWVPECDIEWD